MAEGECSTASTKIRHQMRKDSEKVRSQNRNKAINSVRRNLTEIEEEIRTLNVLTPEELAKTIAGVKSGSTAPVLALRALKQALHDPESTRIFLRTTGSLQAVIGHLTGRKALHQLEAAYICCNLATGDEYACDAVSNAAAPYLIEYLGGQNTTLQTACLWTIGNLAGGSLKSYSIMLSQGLVACLVNCLKCPHEEVVEAAAYALCFVLKTSLHQNNKLSLSCKEMQEIASATTELKCDSNEVHPLLYLLSCSSDCDDILLENSIPQYCVITLVTLLEKTDDISVLRSATALIRTAANLCSIQSGKGAMMILSQDSLPLIVKKFSSSKYTYLNQETEWLLHNLLFHPCIEVTVQARALHFDTRI
ncbi:Transmembrane and coiled-coil domain-containing protein 6 [Frankliniella fusca]|uniref:Transmembrane and coiled-coil domain-containing protein 6 n=1 Tax=Frankliniella fusca TaxID=407009 RepID=A0AAE1I3D4_9NEOP|nr:Transmembrane and coiled-coil domain-containing protein 6 [Frankliniella fusca]